jgi:hypothetical protein
MTTTNLLLLAILLSLPGAAVRISDSIAGVFSLLKLVSVMFYALCIVLFIVTSFRYPLFFLLTGPLIGFVPLSIWWANKYAP